MKRFFLLPIILLAACNGFFQPQPGPPAVVTASQGEFSDSVEVSWQKVNDAGFYVVDRFLSADSTESPETVGITDGNAIVDSDTDEGVHYFYRVKSVNVYDTYESAYSGPAEGWSHLYAWSAPVELFAADFPRIIDFAGSTLHIGYKDPADGSVRISQYDVDEKTHETIASPGTVYPAASAAGVIDIVRSGGEYYAAFIDGAGHVSIAHYSDESWETITSDFSEIVPVKSIRIRLSGNYLYAVYIDGNDTLFVKRRDMNYSSWAGLDFGTPPEALSDPVLLIQNQAPFLGYLEFTAKVPEVFAYNNGWLQVGTAFPSTDDGVEGTFRMVQNAAGGRIQSLYTDSANVIHIREFSDGAWTTLADPGISGSANRLAAVTSLQSSGNSILIAAAAAGVNARSYDVQEETWSDFPAPSILNFPAATDFSVIENGRVLYLLYRQNSKAFLAIYE